MDDSEFQCQQKLDGDVTTISIMQALIDVERVAD